MFLCQAVDEPQVRGCSECGADISHKPKQAVTCGRQCGWVRGKRNSDATRSRRALERNTRCCQRCHVEFKPSRNSQGLFCSRACEGLSRRKYNSKQEAKRAERDRWKARVGWAPKKPTEPRAHVRPECQCVECGTSFVPPYKDKRRTYCSDKCSRRHSRRVRRAIERARRRSLQVEPVNPIKVFERDKWKCALCGIKTPRSLRGSCEPNAPEVDHIVPLSQGGEHSYRNVQCSCRACNGAKGSRPMGQMRLFG